MKRPKTTFPHASEHKPSPPREKGASKNVDDATVHIDLSNLIILLLQRVCFSSFYSASPHACRDRRSLVEKR